MASVFYNGERFVHRISVKAAFSPKKRSAVLWGSKMISHVFVSFSEKENGRLLRKQAPILRKTAPQFFAKAAGIRKLLIPN